MKIKILLFLSLFSLLYSTSFVFPQTTYNSVSASVPYQSNLDTFLERVKQSKQNMTDAQYEARLNRFQSLLEPLKQKYNGNTSIISIINYLQNGITQIQNEFNQTKQSNEISDFFRDFLGVIDSVEPVQQPIQNPQINTTPANPTPTTCGPTPSNVKLGEVRDIAAGGKSYWYNFNNNDSIISHPIISTSNNPEYAGQFSSVFKSPHSFLYNLVWFSDCPGTPYEEADKMNERTQGIESTLRWHNGTSPGWGYDLSKATIDSPKYINYKVTNCPIGEKCGIHTALFTNGKNESISIGGQTQPTTNYGTCNFNGEKMMYYKINNICYDANFSCNNGQLTRGLQFSPMPPTPTDRNIYNTSLECSSR